MALLRFVCFPSPSLFPNQQHQQFFQPINPNPASLQSLSLSASPPNRLLKTHRPNFLVFQTQSAVEAPQVENSTDTVEQLEEELEEEGSRTRLLAQNVPWTCTADEIRPLFEKYGTVVDIEVSMFNKTRNRGLVFVSMGSPEEASAAFSNLQSYEFMGRTLNLAWAKPKKSKDPSTPTQPKPAPVHNLFVANLPFKARSKDPSTPTQPKPAPVHNLFVANLPFKARSKDLMDFFNAENSNAVSAEVIFHENPRSSAGYGFVTFNSKQEADAALTAFQGKTFMGRAIRVSPSKRYLRQSTKKVLESKDESNKLESEGEQEQKADEDVV